MNTLAQHCEDPQNSPVEVGNFEIDGNLCSNEIDDWTSMVDAPSAIDGIDDSTQFGQGASESNWPWSLDQTQKSKTATGASDIGNTYAFQETLDGHVYAFLGFDRATSEGTIQYVIELNALSNDPTVVPLPRRSTGDLRLKVAQAGNGVFELVSSETWEWTNQVKNQGTWAPFDGDADGVVGRANSSLAVENFVIQDFDATKTLGDGRFVELAIDLTTLFGSAGCSGNYGTLNLRSSSSSDTSSLKDWVKPIALNVPSTCSSVQVDKIWDIDGQTYEHGDQPAGFTATLELSGHDDPSFGESYATRSDGTNYELGQTVTVGEAVGALPAGCTNVASGDIGTHTLGAGHNSFTITNKVTCTELTLVKKVVGDASADLWTLTADGPTPLSGVTGSDDVTNSGIEPGDYVLGEASETDGYQLTSISCGENHPVSMDDKTVTIAAGDKVTCTLTNTAEVALTVTKTWIVNGVEYPNGEQPVGTAGLTLDGEQADFGDTTTGYLIGDEVEIAETVDEITETADGLPRLCTLDGTTIDGVEGKTAIHTMTKEPDPNLVEVVNTVTCGQQLTLIKEVDNKDFAGTSTPGDWTLTATGIDNETNASGKTGDDTVTKAKVPVGSYALSEDGPVGYEAGTWTCTGTGDYANDQLDLDFGQEATCTIVNTALPGSVTWLKTDPSENLLAGSIWTLTRVTEPNEFQPLTVEDCVESDAASCTGPDKDPAAGKFALENLPWGSYELDETKAPAGYYPIDEPVIFEITGANRSIGIERTATVNKLREGPAIPLTGGLGRDFFAMLGGGTVLVAVLGAAAIKLRQRRKGVA
ncbi:SpaA isopeptide-forming pilin-related protein [Glutamicibacter nicotianae]|uniref:SpaA isopeptide-forming pilin-related protein n=1 Tax=Glutamicibacter nicotianae TaxID=37929 RepID=UPI0025553712|nr:SpaA isopeptide-forming pilin-related protein [Glutamicibacter nicotianae]WIV45353.1 SpaA isopeptide-forming pilin-related protein [Glutamicibacter nicotianae]